MLVKDESTHEVKGLKKITFERQTRQTDYIKSLINEENKRKTRSRHSLQSQLNRFFEKPQTPMEKRKTRNAGSREDSKNANMKHSTSIKASSVSSSQRQNSSFQKANQKSVNSSSSKPNSTIVNQKPTSNHNSNNFRLPKPTDNKYGLRGRQIGVSPNKQYQEAPLLALNKKGQPQNLNNINDIKEWNFSGRPIKEVLE